MVFAQMMTAVGFSSIFPFLPLYIESLDSSTGYSVEFLAGMVYAAQAFTMMLASPIWGGLADRYGRKIMVERAMFGGAVLLLLMAFVQTAEQLVVLRAIQGFITGTLPATNALVAAVVPRQRTGFSMGALQVGLGTGVAVGPLIGGAIADTYGYSAAFFVTSALLLASGLLVLFGIKEDFTPAKVTSAKQVGLIAGWQSVLITPGVSSTFSLRFLSQVGRMMILPILSLFIVTLMPDSARVNTFTGLVIGIGSATTTVSAIFLGRLGDQVGHRRVLVPSSIAAALLYAAQTIVTAGWQLLGLQALVGVAMGGILPTISALLAGYTQPGEEGAVYGLDHSINAGGRAVAPIVGAAVATLFSTRATFAATAIIFLLAGLLALWQLPKPRKVQQTRLA